jgi:hypothetical protein
LAWQLHDLRLPHHGNGNDDGNGDGDDDGDDGDTNHSAFDGTQWHLLPVKLNRHLSVMLVMIDINGWIGLSGDDSLSSLSQTLALLEQEEQSIQLVGTRTYI